MQDYNESLMYVDGDDYKEMLIKLEELKKNQITIQFAVERLGKGLNESEEFNSKWEKVLMESYIDEASKSLGKIITEEDIKKIAKLAANNFLNILKKKHDKERNSTEAPR